MISNGMLQGGRKLQQCRDAGAVPAGVAPLADATVYLGAFLSFTVAKS